MDGYLIDILLPFALYLLLGVSGLPVVRSPLARGIIVLAIGGAVELLQYFGVPLFGATFDVLDLLMYALGVGGAVALERTVIAVRPPTGCGRTRFNQPRGVAPGGG